MVAAQLGFFFLVQQLECRKIADELLVLETSTTIEVILAPRCQNALFFFINNDHNARLDFSLP